MSILRRIADEIGWYLNNIKRELKYRKNQIIKWWKNSSFLRIKKTLKWWKYKLTGKC